LRFSKLRLAPPFESERIARNLLPKIEANERIAGRRNTRPTRYAFAAVAIAISLVSA
jgi:hypothetical protein